MRPLDLFWLGGGTERASGTGHLSSVRTVLNLSINEVFTMGRGGSASEIVASGSRDCMHTTMSWVRRGGRWARRFTLGTGGGETGWTSAFDGSVDDPSFCVSSFCKLSSQLGWSRRKIRLCISTCLAVLVPITLAIASYVG